MRFDEGGVLVVDPRGVLAVAAMLGKGSLNALARELALLGDELGRSADDVLEVDAAGAR